MAAISGVPINTMGQEEDIKELPERFCYNFGCEWGKQF
jgi:hypothetical protein